MGWTMLVVRLLVALAASALLLMGMIEPGPAAAIGMLGFGLIAPSGGWIRNRSREETRGEKIERTIYSPDRRLRAFVISTVNVYVTNLKAPDLNMIVAPYKRQIVDNTSLKGYCFLQANTVP